MLSGYTLRVVKSCPPLLIGETVYCIEDCPTRRVFRVYTPRGVFGVNEVIFGYGKRECFKII